MTSAWWLGNLAAWWLQTGVITAAAALLLRELPVRSPRAALGYLQGLLCVCLVLPALEPWRVATVIVRISPGLGAASRVFAVDSARVSIPSVVLLVLGSGIAIRLVWLAVGYGKLCRCQREAWPLGAEVAALQERLGVHAETYVAPEIEGPVTFGFWRPTILLPARWPELDPATRAAIAYHELLHVRRNDWAFHAAEEIIRALAWFHPAIWWLTAEIRLAREQVVDRMVAEFTGGPKPYAELLLAFSGVDCGDAAPAFLRKRHLTRRIKSLLEEVSMTKSRLLLSLGSMTVCLAAAGAIAVWSFPLESVESNLITQGGPAAGVAGGVVGNVGGGVHGGVIGGVPGGVIGGVVGGVPGVRTVASQQNPKLYKAGENGVTAPKVLSKTDPVYTQEARDAKVEGTVVLQTEIHPDGRAHNTAVIRSLDSGLDQNAIDAIALWEFQPATKDGVPVAVTATIEINYRLK